MFNLKASVDSEIFKQRTVMAAIAVAALLVVGSGAFTISQLRASKSDIAETAVVSPPEIKTVTALGRLEPQGEVITLSAPMSAEGSRVEQLLVKEGDRVKAGQVIAILDSRDRLQAALAEATERVRVAQANLAKVKAGAKSGEISAQKAEIARIQAERQNQIAAQQAEIARIKAERQNEIAAQQATIARLKAELDNAQVEYQRNQKLYEDGAISTSVRDSKQLAVDAAQQRLKEAEANLNRIISTKVEQLKQAEANLNRIISTQAEQIKAAQATLEKIAEVRPVDVQAAQAEVSSSLAGVKRAQANLEQAYVRSSRSGQVLKIHTFPGELIASEGIAELGETSQMYAVAEVYESDINKVRVGQQVKITSDSLNGELQGTVEQIGLQVKKQNVINADPSANIDNRVIEVRIRLDANSSQKVAGFTNLQIEVAISI